MPDVLLPDPGEAFRLWAVSRPAVTNIAGQRVSVALAGSAAAIRYVDLGGPEGAYGEAQALLQVECWGQANAPDDGTASLLARTVAVEVEQFRGVWGDAWVAGAAVDGRPYDSPDQQTARPRKIMTVRINLYPMEET